MINSEDSDATPSCAQLEWDAQGQPISTHFSDVYFSKSHGLNESRYVFLEHNNLAERFASLAAGQQFIIGETGFGTGLNFLACWQLWLNTAPPNARLHFISVEKYPPHKNDMHRALQLWPELGELATALLDAYPAMPATDFIRLNFGAQVSLTLILQEATSGFKSLLVQTEAAPRVAQQLNQKSLHAGGPPWAVDAWFLDGFAPAKNPDMWHSELFYTLARLSKPGTSFATFTAAAVVKNGLNAAGFSWQKVPGFGRKRHMLKGELQALSSLTPARRRAPSAWHLMQQPHPSSPRIAIIGAGLAGAHTAAALAKKGQTVAVFERGTLGQGGSGNPQGVVYAKLSHKPEAFADINFAAFLFACHFYQRENHFTKLGGACGVLQLATPKQQSQFAQIAQHYQQATDFVRWCTPTQASAIAGITIEHPALFFPQTGWLNPPALCRELLNHPNIQLHEHCEITGLTQTQTGWQLNGAPPALSNFTHVILACAEQTQHFTQSAAITSKAIRGQITLIEPSAGSALLNTVICGEGYIAPACRGQQCIGATFNPNSNSLEILPQDRTKNLVQAAQLSPDLMSLEAMGDRAALRNVTPDYLPIIGPVAQATDFTQSFAALRTNLKASIDCPAPYYPNLYVNLGHGSRGLTYTPLCAEILCNLIMGEPLAVSNAMFLQLHAARFLVRDLARGRI